MKKAGLLLLLFCSASLLWAGDWDYKTFNKRVEITGGKKYEIFIDVDAGEVTVTRSDKANTLSVFMEYEEEYFHERMKVQKDRRRIKIVLKHRGSIFKSGDKHAVVNIELPSNTDLYIDSRIKAGEVKMDLGGIPIKELSLKNWAGESTVTFYDPNPVVMDFLGINVKVGEAYIEKLGNARALEMDINSGIGSLSVDLNGDVVDGSKVKIDLDIGEASVTMPENAGVKFKVAGLFKFMSAKDIDPEFYRRGSYYYSEDFETMKKKIFVRITPGLGELSVSR